jgi:hypothetical protein
MTLWELECWLKQRGPAWAVALRACASGKFEVAIEKNAVVSHVGKSKTLDGALGAALEDLRLDETRNPPAPPLPPGFAKVNKIINVSLSAAPVPAPPPAPTPAPTPAPAPAAATPVRLGPNGSCYDCLSAPAALHFYGGYGVCARCFNRYASTGPGKVWNWSALNVGGMLIAVCNCCRYYWAGVNATPTCVCP